MTTIRDRLESIFRKVFDDESLDVQPSMTANDVSGWDSFSHVNLILAVESEFAIKFSTSELLRFKSIGDLLTSVEEKCPRR